MKVLSAAIAAACLASCLQLAGTAQTAESDFITQARQLILSGKRSGEGYFGPQGRYLIFQSEREANNPFFQMYLLDFEKGDIQRVSNGVGKNTCGWVHPNQKQIMYSSTHSDPASAALQKQELDFRTSGQQRRYSWDYDPQYEIYSADLNGKNPRNLTRTLGYDAEGSYSPDGKEIVFASNRQAYTRKLSAAEQERLKIDPAYFIDLYIMNADGSNVRQLTNQAGYDGGPFFSADGRKLVFRRFNEAGDKAEIWNMNRDGSQPQQLTNLGVMSWAPYYHPSGDYLIFATNLHGFGNFELYLVDAAGKKQPVRVTDTEGFDGLPTFSPDGKQLSWTSGRTADGASQIFLAKWNHAAALAALKLAPPASALKPSDSSVSAPAAASPAAAPRFQTTPAITAADLRKHIGYFASPALAGRMTGSAGEALATSYATQVFQQLGLEPAGDNGGYLQAFEFTSGISLGANPRLKMGAQTYRQGQDWTPLVFSESGHFDAQELVFAGYGLRAPATGTYEEYDAYFHLDVKDKWVAVLRYWPENLPDDQRSELKRYAALRYKAMQARNLGAKGLIVINDQDQPIVFSSQSTPGALSLPVVSVSRQVAEQWFQAAGKDFNQIQKQLDQGQGVQGFSLSKAPISLDLELKRERKTGHNVLAKLTVPGSTRTVVIGAHLDHLGQGASHSSLATGDAADQIHFGADDNASGSAGVLELAESITQRRSELKQNVLFALWSGEELGLLGSSHFVEQDKANFARRYSAYFNMDMIGRMQKALVLQGIGSSPLWKPLIEKQNLMLGLPLVLQETAYLPTDVTSFYTQKVPVLNAFTGAHADYHTPTDTADKIEYEQMVPILNLLERLSLAVASEDLSPAYLEQAAPESNEGRGLRIYLGTIPDYAGAEVKGLKLAGVSKGGPAELAGLQAGDVIVELNGKKIENIYDYTYAIDTLKAGKLASIVVLRGSERLSLAITPGSRK